MDIRRWYGSRRWRMTSSENSLYSTVSPVGIWRAHLKSSSFVSVNSYSPIVRTDGTDGRFVVAKAANGLRRWIASGVKGPDGSVDCGYGVDGLELVGDEDICVNRWISSCFAEDEWCVVWDGDEVVDEDIIQWRIVKIKVCEKESDEVERESL